MGGVGVQHVSWDEALFEKAFAQSLVVYSDSECTSEALGPIPCTVESLQTNEQILGGTESKKYG